MFAFKKIILCGSVFSFFAAQAAESNNDRNQKQRAERELKIAATAAPKVTPAKERRFEGNYNACGTRKLNDKDFVSIAITGGSQLARVSAQRDIHITGGLTGEDIEARSLDVTGHTTLARGKFTEKIEVTGGFNGTDIEAESLSVTGATTLERAKFTERVNTSGGLTASDFATNILDISGRTNLTDAHVTGLSTLAGSLYTQNALLGAISIACKETRLNSTTTGPITFVKSGGSHVIKCGSGVVSVSGCRAAGGVSCISIDPGANPGLIQAVFSNLGSGDLSAVLGGIGSGVSISTPQPEPVKLYADKDSEVSGDITFEDGAGEVHADKGFKLHGRVIGGTIITK